MRVAVLGVSQLSDSYPNVIYKIEALQRLYGDDVCVDVRSNGGERFSAGPGRGFGARFGSMCRFLLGHAGLLLHWLPRVRSFDRVYVVYPGIFVVLGLLVLPRSWRAPIVLDAFISLYDTVVNDRRLLRRDSLLARLLYRFERRAFSGSTRVIVDTEENKQFYAGLFCLSADKFASVPLSVPALQPVLKPAGPTLNCLFIGTFVPLQGVPVLAEVAALLQDRDDIKLTVVGTGQDAGVFRSAIEHVSHERLCWIEGHLPTEKLVALLEETDVCLGIFGSTAKTARVLPFKIYYYLASGKPVVTAGTDCLQRLENLAPDRSPFVLTDRDAASVAAALQKLADDKATVSAKAVWAREFYARFLSTEAVDDALNALMEKSVGARTGKRVN
ncbi:glycosyltransferase [Granulosicoccaceae sp. 1_MG-2023]|nr:glycosyltransferase [Granulosicoccaceae sp. 1_MG-2023]